MPATVSHLFSYPIKGLQPQSLGSVQLQVGEVFPYDRLWAIKKGNWLFDPAHPEYKPKTNFFMLMRDEKLARLRYRFNSDEQEIDIQDPDGRRLVAILALEEGRKNLARFLEPFLGEKCEIIAAPNHSFSDVDMKVVSIIGTPSVQALGKAMGAPNLDPLRFRANLYFNADQPWAEFDWVGKCLQIGDATLEVVKRIVRCAATTVNLKTGQRDHNVPKALIEYFQHADMGVYAKVISAGAIRPGDEIKIL